MKKPKPSDYYAHSYSDISKALNLSTKTIKTIEQQALQKIKVALFLKTYKHGHPKDYL